jgi:hypothetical protein
VTASLVQRDSVAKPGGTVTYSIWVWSTVESRHVTAMISRTGHATYAPKFALCPAIRRRTCLVGSLPAYQALELLVTDHIGKKATAGEQISLTVVVEGAAAPPGGSLSPAEAAVSTVLGRVSSAPPTTPPPGTGGTFPPTTPGLPGTTISPGSITSLFPTVTPSASPATRGPAGNRKVTRATSTASSLPLDPRLIGGQLAGLAVLAAAITMVVARLSLRTPQLASAPGPTAAAAPPAQTSDTAADTGAGTGTGTGEADSDS